MITPEQRAEAGIDAEPEPADEAAANPAGVDAE